MTAGATVSMRDLEFSYPGGNSVLTSINLDIDRGERVAILGPWLGKDHIRSPAQRAPAPSARNGDDR